MVPYVARLHHVRVRARSSDPRLVRWRLARLERQNAKLNRLVSERTRELELSNTAKSEFLENISHELRNPLNGMLGMVSQLEEERLEPRDRPSCEPSRAARSK